MTQNNNTPNRGVAEINLRDEAVKYLRYWPWFILTIILALGLAFLILRYTSPVYSTSATIIIKDGKNSQNSEMAAFADLGLLNGMNSNSIQNEIGILNSRRLMEEVVKALDLNIVYLNEEAVRSPELYDNSPYLVKILSLDQSDLNSDRSIRLESIDSNRIKLTKIANNETFKVSFGEPVELGFATVLIVPNDSNLSKDIPIVVQFHTIEKIASNYRAGLKVNIKENNSSLIELSLNDEVKAKAQDILDQLVLEYNKEAIEDKNQVALNTAEFIDERLAIINEELDSVETGKVKFKEKNDLTDIQAESQIFMSSASEFKKRRQELDTQIELTNAMLAYLKSSGTSDLLPANLGIEESGVNSLIAEYNELVLERNRILGGSTERNPVVIKLNNQLKQLKANVLGSLNNLRSNLSIADSNLAREAAAIGSRIASVPSAEKQFRGIERQQQIKETLYLFLLQKREENSLSLAVTAPKAKIVDTAYSSSKPVSPNTQNFYLTALLLGIGIPFGFIYLKNLLNNKVNTKEEIEKAINGIPVVGEIPRVGRRESEMIVHNDRSILAEAFRILHTNLQYLIVNSAEKQGRGNTIFITSTVKGEGKTLTAFNLALTLAYSNKNILIIGADLRNPQLQRFEADARDHKGVSDYLANNEVLLEDVIRKSQLHSNLDLLASGSIPPNPSELWRRAKTGEMFKELENQYDYIIVDTAPSLVVTDTFLINKWADITLYIVRSGYTDLKLLKFAEDAKRDGKLHDVSFVLNDVKWSNFGYGNKYGYAYGEQTESLLDKIKKRLGIW